MTARNTFLTSLDTLRLAVQSDHILKQAPPLPGSPTPAHNNEVARVSRSGLAVVGFAVLEEFIRSRSAELVTAANSGAVSFSRLPKPLQQAATEGVVHLLRRRIADLRREDLDPLALIQDTAQSLTSTRGTALILSPLALDWDGSNLNADDVADLLKRLQVHHGWNQITDVARRAGFTLQDARGAFVQTQQNRHRAAHAASADVDVLEIRSLPTTIMAIAVAFDALASQAAQRLRDNHSGYSTGTPVTSADIRFRFLDERNDGFAELLEGRTRATRIHLDISSAFAACTARAATSGDVVVRRDPSGIPSEWRTTTIL